MGATFDRAVWLAAQLNAVGVAAVVDVAAAVGNLPCVLVPPPRQVYTDKSIEWRLVVLGPGPASTNSWSAIDDLADLLAAQLPVETADPGVYILPNGDPAGVACYVVTFTDTAP